MGGKTTSTTATKLNSISVQSSVLGKAITLGWGRGRATCNLGDYVAFTATPHTTKQSAGKGLGGGSTNTTYTYTASIILFICEGGATGIQGIRTVYRDTSVFTDGATTALAQAGLSLATGALDQPVWGYLTSMFPDHALAYSGIAYVYAQDYDLGDSASLSNHSFEIDFALQLGGGVCDADPSAIATDVLTNPYYGVPGWTSALLGDLSSWSTYARANGLLLSPVLESQVQASAFLTEISDASNTYLFSSEGLLKATPRGDEAATGNGATWTPNLVPEYDLDEGDFCPSAGDPPVSLAIVDQSDAYNLVQIEFLDRSNQYNTAIMPASDPDNIATYGRRKQDPTSWHSICDATVAGTAAQLLLSRTLYIREEYTFRLPWDFVLLEPTDLVTLTTITDSLKLSRKLVRITDIEEDEDGYLTFTAEGMNIGTATAAEYVAHTSAGYQKNADVAPGSVSTPALLNPPTSLTGGDPEIWCAAASTSPTWGGCEVWISVDNVAYQRVGRIEGPARYGVLTADLPTHADPDGDSTLAVDLGVSMGQLGSATAAEAAAGASLCLVGSELVTYQTAALTGANTYALTQLHRGFEGTAPADHPAGTEFVRIDDAVFRFSYRELNVGSTIHVKLPSFNLYGRALEDLAAIEAFTVDLTPATALPGKVTGLALAQAWDGSTLQVVCDTAVRATAYRFRFYASDETTLLREVVSSTPSATYTASLAQQDGVQRAYAIEAIASNDAGTADPSSWLTVSNAAPAAVTSSAIAGGDTTAVATCDASADGDLGGYALFYASTSGFNPATTGGVVTSGVPSIAVYGLAAGTYYGRIAAYDAWTLNPTLLNLSDEISFTIATGGGSTPSGGGTTGGGFAGACPEEHEPILLANDARDGPGIEVAAKTLLDGEHWVWSRHEHTGAWGAYRVLRARRLAAMLYAHDGLPRTSDTHLFTFDEEPGPDGFGWMPMETLGEPDDLGWVIAIEVEDAHTYVCGGRLSHNKRVAPDDLS